MKQFNRSTYISGSTYISLEILAAILSVLICGHAGFAQTERSPDRTFQAGNSFAVSDIESVNLTNGNVLVNLPLASLPKGRGTSPGYSISLQYNSKLWNARKEYREDGTADETGSRKYTRDLLEYAADGGWHFKADYKLKVTDRQALSDREECAAQNADYAKNGYRWQVEIEFPGGGGKAFRPFGGGAYYEDHFKDGFFEIDPNGKAVVEHLTSNPSLNCTATPITVTTSGMSYYSTDGSGVRLFIPYLAGAQPNTPNRTWIMSFPDGTTIENLPPDETSVTQRTIDRNGNRIVLKGGTFNNLQGTKIEDSVGRFIFLATTENGDSKIFQTGFNGAVLETTVEWKQYWVYRNYKATDALNAAASKRREDALLTSVWVDKITLPSQASSLTYEFGYGGATGTLPTFQDYTAGWGELTSVKLPSGAEADYHYDLPENESVLTNSFHILNNSITRKDLKYDQTYDGQTTPAIDTWTYNIGSGSASVTAPNGNITGQSAYPQDNTRFGGLVYGVTNSDGSVVERIWAQNGATQNAPGQAINPYVKTELTTISNAAGQKALTAIKDYIYDQNMNVLEVREYDWVSYGAAHPGQGILTIPGGAVLKRKTVNAYYNQANVMGGSTLSSNYYANPGAPKLLNLLKSTEMQDGNGTVAARSEFIYDNAPTNPTSGNLTETRIWDSSKAATLPSPDSNGFKLVSGNYINTQTTYDQYGNPLTITDANGMISNITYDPVNGYAGLYPTKTETASNYSALKRTATASYDFYTGLVTSSTDVDNNLTSAVEYDALGRPIKNTTAIGTPLENWTQTEYDDVNRRVTVRSDIEVKGDGKKIGIQHYDQLGRVRLSRSIENVSTENPYNEAHGIKVQTRYQTGNPYSYQLTSNPYRAATLATATNESSIGWTRSKSINTGRHSETETFAGANLPAPLGLNVNSTGKIQTDIDSSVTIVTDQAGKQRRSIVNGLGQIIRVDEPDNFGSLGSINTPVQATNYIYNTLGKMIEVTQGVQQRHFLYDSIGRLLRVRQPEQQVNPALNLSNPQTTNTQWTVGFSYDANGNLLTTTDAKNVTTTVKYDALNRVQTRSYSDGITPPVNYSYDDAIVPFSKGKLTKVSSTISETRYTIYDTLGRLVSSEQVTDGRIFPTKYKYNLAGTLIEETYPSGRTVKNFLEADGDLSAISSKMSNGQFKTYASNFAYTASGVIERLQIGSGLWESAKMNSRGQVTELNLGTSPTDGSLWKLNYDYGTMDENGNIDKTKNAGNIVKQTVGFTGLAKPFVQTYKYDSLDRITEAKEMSGTNQTWKQNWSYDRYGNRTAFSQNILSQQLGINNQTLPAVDTNTNKFQVGQGYGYDANGNLIQDFSGRQFTFDGDNKQTLVKDASNNVVGRYYYDGNGKRVKKVTNLEMTIFVYDGTGKLVAEYSTATPATNPTTSYTATDPLGSPRVITNKQGQIISRRDFMPFGEELAPDANYRTANLKYGTVDNIRQKFTGYQRDEETNLDFAEARYYNNAHGRFTAVDPLLASGKSGNPQTFNRYVYTMNRPLILTDPTGLQVGKKLIPLPEPLLQLASLDTRSGVSDKGESISFTLTPDEVNQRIELATLAYNEGFEAGERNAQERLGQNVEVNSVESVDSLSNEKSKEISTEKGISISPKDVGISEKQTDKIGAKDTNNGSYKVGGKVESGLFESVAGTKDLAKARQTVINEQSSKVRDVIGKNDQSTKSKVNVTSIVDDLMEKSTVLGKSHGYTNYIRSNLIKQE